MMRRNVPSAMPLDAEDLAHPPDSGGKGKIILLGIVIPAVIGFLAAKAWITEEAFWPGKRGGMTITDDAARAMAVCYLSVALFCHFRWFWGLLGAPRIFLAGTVCSLLAFLVSLIAAFCYAIA